MKLLLFDIDGTLLLTHGLGRRVVAEAPPGPPPRPVDPYGATFAGKTDPQIFRELIARECDAGAEVGDPDDAMRTALAAYEKRMGAQIAGADVTALPGAVELVAHLAQRDDVLLGLLTGNLQPLAYAKVARAGFGPGHFAPGLGGFGSDHEDRDCLGPVALARARALAGRPFEGRDTVVVGDTPRDVACARAIGATVVGVATGGFTREGLAQADLVLDRLDAADALLALLDGREAG